MTDRTSRRTALVTGGARRIGRAIVRDLAAQGWAVVIHCNNSVAEAEAEAQAINQAGGEAIVIRADLQDADAVSALIPSANAQIGPLDLLVNNASVFLEDGFGALDAKIWQRQFAVNLQAPVFLADAFAAQLPADARGNIVNLIDQRVWKLNPQMASYTLSKSALWTATRTMAQALAPRIRVNGIGPGPTFPNPRDGENGLRREASATLLVEPIDPAEIGAAVRFLVDTASITGQMLALDGGQHLAWQTPDIVDNEE
jgi:NAD(P)-dependent dehydrogenase (short-subunit alcohol dehydrogenase family)